MELYDEKIDKKESKLPTIILICVIILIFITGMIIYGIIYLRNSITTVQIDGVKQNGIEELFYIETTEEGTQVYFPIIKMAQFFGYEGFKGDYKNKSEDKNKCHVVSENEVAMFTVDSNILVKTTPNSDYEYIKIDKAILEKDGELYTTVEGLEKAFNITFSNDEKYKNIEIYTMDYLVKYFAAVLGVEEYSENYTDQKAIFENMLIIKKDGKYGVISAENGESVLETKYQSISYLPATSDFLIQTNGKYGVVGKDSTMKIRTVYDEIKSIDNQNGLYLVKQNNTYGIVNLEGQTILAPEYRQIGVNIDKYIQNGVENKYILLDEIIPIQNVDGLWGLYNLKSKKIIECQYEGLGCQTSPATNSYPVLVVPSYKILVVQKNKKYNLVTIEGEELISGYILDSVYLKTNTETEQNQYFMTSNNNTKVINIEEWLASIGK